ncbi:hypothetical protein [Pyxidicoccus sp. MSG2]|uniref:hypothetical protein n=1 Tax=Pyxidicoccus sp. MSG2 TaxID=2996790 RepID=UPI00226FA085|nr:hypothetical protein [Pyxidicoccus sp. MSG2]MCY1022820.1 hypothetical protein [Pyxidicoccus sp. MSG2]
MRNLPGVLVFSTALLLAVGCHKNTGEGPGPTDAATTQPDPRDAMEAVKDAGAPSDGAQTGTSRGALTAGDDAGAPSKDAGAMTKGGGDRKTLEACVDRWLQDHGLDKYGHAEGTMYAGGTPLFDERTGEQKDRMEYVFQRKPEARQACAK